MRWFAYAKFCNYNTESEVQYFSVKKKIEWTSWKIMLALHVVQDDIYIHFFL